MRTRRLVRSTLAFLSLTCLAGVAHAASNPKAVTVRIKCQLVGVAGTPAIGAVFGQDVQLGDGNPIPVGTVSNTRVVSANGNVVLRTGSTERLIVDPMGNVGIGTLIARDVLDVNGTIGFGPGRIRPQVTSSVPAATPTTIYVSGCGELAGALYIQVGGGGNSAMYEYRLMTNSDGVAAGEFVFEQVRSVSRGAPGAQTFSISNNGGCGDIKVQLTNTTPTAAKVTFVGLENH